MHLQLHPYCRRIQLYLIVVLLQIFIERKCTAIKSSSLCLILKTIVNMFFFSSNECFSMSFLTLYEGRAYNLTVISETLDEDKVKPRFLEHLLVDIIYICVHACTFFAGNEPLW